MPNPNVGFLLVGMLAWGSAGAETFCGRIINSGRTFLTDGQINLLCDNEDGEAALTQAISEHFGYACATYTTIIQQNSTTRLVDGCRIRESTRGCAQNYYDPTGHGMGCVACPNGGYTLPSVEKPVITDCCLGAGSGHDDTGTYTLGAECCYTK